MGAIGHRRWAIAEGHIPGASTGPAPDLESHETACMLNAGDEDAHVTITLFFSDREPAGPYDVVVRLLDVTISAVALVVLAPVMVVIAALIRATNASMRSAVSRF